jgi:hypothetical protein
MLKKEIKCGGIQQIKYGNYGNYGNYCTYVNLVKNRINNSYLFLFIYLAYSRKNFFC